VSASYLLLAVCVLAQPQLDAAALPFADAPSPGPSLLAPSSVEPLSPAAERSARVTDASAAINAAPLLVQTETPQWSWLASWQSGYLWLMGDDGRALAGFYDPFSYQFAYGAAGPQPYRLGWYSYNDYVLMSNSPTSAGGNFRDQQWNAWMRYACLGPRSTVFTWTGWANGKFWTGPSGLDLPPDGVQLISDFQLASAYREPWNWQLGFAPQLNGSLEGKLNSNALMADARGVLFYRFSPQWMVAMGAAYWNRATDRLIPYGGVIWAPDDRWELRFMFPKSRASYYVGRFSGADTWIYASAEYTVDAYQVDFDHPAVTTRGEMSDYRILLGASATSGIWTLFLEGGLVTDRHFRFRGPAPDFVMDDCAMLRTGLLF